MDQIIVLITVLTASAYCQDTYNAYDTHYLDYSESESIPMCYVCRSERVSGCDYPFDERIAQKCENNFGCYVLIDTHHDGSRAVTRGCVPQEMNSEKDECVIKQDVLRDEETCYCFGDLCNGARSKSSALHKHSLSLVISWLIFVSLYFLANV